MLTGVSGEDDASIQSPDFARDVMATPAWTSIAGQSDRNLKGAAAETMAMAYFQCRGYTVYGQAHFGAKHDLIVLDKQGRRYAVEVRCWHGGDYSVKLTDSCDVYVFVNIETDECKIVSGQDPVLGPAFIARRNQMLRTVSKDTAETRLAREQVADNGNSGAAR